MEITESESPLEQSVIQSILETLTKALPNTGFVIILTQTTESGQVMGTFGSNIPVEAALDLMRRLSAGEVIEPIYPPGSA